MFILFMILLATSLAGLASHLFTTLTLQAQTVSAVHTLFKYEQYTQGLLSYAVAALACNEPLQKEITQKKMVEQACDLWNNAKNGFIEGAIVYRPAPSGYSIEIRVQQGGNCCGGMRVHIIKEESAQKNTFSCVAIEPY